MSLDQINARVDAIAATNNNNAYHGVDEANAKPHQEVLLREQQAAVYLLHDRTILERRGLIQQLNARIKTMEEAARTEGDLRRRAAMDRTLVALRELVSRVAASGGISDTVVNTGIDAGQAIGEGFQNQVNTFRGATTGGRIVQGTMLVAAGTGLWVLLSRAGTGTRNFFRRLFGREPVPSASASSTPRASPQPTA